MSWFDITRQPDACEIMTETSRAALSRHQDTWTGQGVEVEARVTGAGLRLFLTAPQPPVRRLILRWRGSWSPHLRILGDHWERSYGDLEWRGVAPERPLPWYCLVHDGERTHGYGVTTDTAALAWWQVDGQGITLHLDIGSGTAGVQLGARRLSVATVVSRQGTTGESAFAAAGAFCKLLCPRPLLPESPVYGGNDWYYAYGANTQAGIIEDARRLAAWTAGLANRPFSVIDAGWAINGFSYGGPWHTGNSRFPDLPGLAAAIKSLGVRPGIWIRPLLTAESDMSACASPLARFERTGKRRYLGYHLDPSRPQVLERVAADIRRLTGWGYELIKHDFTSYDIFGRWGFDLMSELTLGGFEQGGSTPVAWSFADRSLTTAEVIRRLYQTIREAAGKALVIGCNTINPLSAGTCHLQRIGDDTSGREWERTRKMGVNALAFRLPQHNAFFAVDADCVPVTPQVAWPVTQQWLDLVAGSGTPLFVSADANALTPDRETAISQALQQSAKPHPPAEPLDWLDTTCPRHWRINGGERHFDWLSP
jgi:alpha-galactosidase